MKIKNQFLISLVAFSIILIIIAVSVIITEAQTVQLNNQDAIARDIQTGDSNLYYISNNYFLYQENSSISLWQNQLATLANDISQLKPTNAQQQALFYSVSNDTQNVNTVFIGVVSFLETAPRNVSVRVLPEFQLEWSKMAVQLQSLSFDTQQLSQSLRQQVDKANFENLILIVAFLGLFGIYFLTNYIIMYRRTYKSISESQEGISVIGSGNLDYSLKANRNDEVGDISRSVKQMVANLKIVTASKADLEKEIGEREKAEREMAEAKQRLEAHINNAPEAVIEFDSQFRVMGWSEEASRMFGWSVGEIVGRSIMEMPWVYKDDVKIVEQVSGDMLSGKSPRNIGLNRNYRKDGAVIDCEWYNSAIYGNNGKLVSILSHVLDVTERNQLQQRLEEKAAEVEEYATRMEELAEERALKLKDSERLATIGATAGMVGHDIRNPLQAITSDVYLAKSELDSIPESEQKKNALESMDEIEKNIDYINKIVQDLQDFARPINPRREETDLKIIIEKLLIKNGLPENVKASIKVTADARKIFADSYYLNRILSNLVTNSLQAMPNGGKLAIDAHKAANKVIITVSDTGVGISKDIQNKIFTVMFTTKSKGQGFGLPVVKRMTESLGGTVTFESQEGKGTTFTLRLPYGRIEGE